MKTNQSKTVVKSNSSDETLEVSIRELYNVLDVVSTLTVEPEEESKTDETSKSAKKTSKVVTALNAFIQHTVKPALEKYQLEVQKINIRFCTTDKDGSIMYDDKDRLKYTVSSEISRRDAIERLKDTEVTIKKHTVMEIDALPEHWGHYNIEMLNKFLDFRKP